MVMDNICYIAISLGYHAVERDDSL